MSMLAGFAIGVMLALRAEQQIGDEETVKNRTFLPERIGIYSQRFRNHRPVIGDA
jgi:hypothetical protein